MKLIAGLGNPGEKYQGTRHNLGFELIEEFRRKHGLGDWQKDKSGFKAEYIKTNLKLKTKDSELILVRPLTFMNNSGMAVAALASFFKIPPSDIIIIHDELDLHRGTIKVRLGGSGAGHHGIESIIDKLGTDKFIRVRLGIGNWKTQSSEHGGNHLSVEHFVLAPFLPKEKSTVKSLIKKGVGAIEVILEKGIESAQNQFN